MNKVSINRK